MDFEPHIETIKPGEPETSPLTDTELELITSGLLIPTQAMAKSMAHELRKLRGVPNPDSI
jgi:hypothetical protein